MYISGVTAHDKNWNDKSKLKCMHAIHQIISNQDIDCGTHEPLSSTGKGSTTYAVSYVSRKYYYITLDIFMIPVVTPFGLMIINGSINSLSPVRRQAITWTYDDY